MSANTNFGVFMSMNIFSMLSAGFGSVAREFDNFPALNQPPPLKMQLQPKSTNSALQQVFLVSKPNSLKPQFSRPLI
jgi:hypothetical protein